jgi:tRNA (guanine-N7-)-methyltransferase
MIPDSPQFYGRRKGRRLRPAMQGLMETMLPGLRLDPHQPLTGQFGTAERDIFLEIGFGGGENLAAMAGARPADGFIGAEPFVNGVASLLRHIHHAERHDAESGDTESGDAANADSGLANIRIWDDDIRLVLPHMADASLAGAYVLFPDPWPKHRHSARRILHAPMLDHLARLIRPGGKLVLASDHPVAKLWLLQLAMAHPDFHWTARRPADWREMPDELNATRYMRKAERESRVPSWFVFRRNAD